jgi:N6-adenosine-specific RNA methylase IME4
MRATMSELLDTTILSLLSIADPNNLFATILADPPWPSKSHPEGVPRNRWIGTNMRPSYQTLKAAEILALPVGDIAAPDSVLVMWATWMHLDLALKCIDAWGFRYATGMPWLKVCAGQELKPIFGPGVWFQHCTELVLIGRRGKPFGKMGNPRPARKGIVIAPRGEEHSEKPEEVQDWIDGAGFPGPKLEMFARRTRPGWASWGDEVANADTAGNAAEPAPDQCPDEDRPDQ